MFEVFCLDMDHQQIHDRSEDRTRDLFPLKLTTSPLGHLRPEVEQQFLVHKPNMKILISRKNKNS